MTQTLTVSRQQAYHWIREQQKPVRRIYLEQKFGLSRSQCSYLFELLAAEGSIVLADRRVGWWKATNQEPGEKPVTLPRNVKRAKPNKREEDVDPPITRPHIYPPPRGSTASLMLAACLGYPSPIRPEIEPYKPPNVVGEAFA